MSRVVPVLLLAACGPTVPLLPVDTGADPADAVDWGALGFTDATGCVARDEPLVLMDPFGDAAVGAADVLEVRAEMLDGVWEIVVSMADLHGPFQVNVAPPAPDYVLDVTLDLPVGSLIARLTNEPLTDPDPYWTDDLMSFLDAELIDASGEVPQSLGPVAAAIQGDGVLLWIPTSLHPGLAYTDACVPVTTTALTWDLQAGAQTSDRVPDAAR